MVKSMVKGNPDSTKKAIEKVLHDSDLIEHSKLKNVLSEQLNNEWFYFALSYLHASKSLIKTVITGNNLDSRMHLIPAVYNFRHAVELSLKLLFKLTNANLIKQHDILVLYENVISNLKNSVDLNVKKFVANNTDARFSEKEVNKIIEKEIDNLKAIVNKYYFQTSIRKTVKMEHIFIVDKDNELFKYPEANNVTFYFQSVDLLNMESNELNLIISDIEEMTFIIRLFYTLFTDESPKK